MPVHRAKTNVTNVLELTLNASDTSITIFSLTFPNGFLFTFMQTAIKTVALQLFIFYYILEVSVL